MDAVELFAGIGGFRVAAESMGIRTVWANDCCPKASKVYQARFGDTGLGVGDIRELKQTIPSHDILTAGFPCQPFSSAGKKRGIRDSRGTLFNEVVDVLARLRPRYFILENVKRLLTMESGAHFATILSALANLDYRIEWRLLNAANFGLAQNRQRVFIVGVRGQLKDHEEDVVRLAPPRDFRGSNVDPGILAEPRNWFDIGDHGRRFPNWGLARNGRFYGHDLEDFRTRHKQVLLRDVLQDDAPPEFDFTASTLVRIKQSKPVRKFVDGVEILVNQSGGARMGYTVFGIGGIAPTLTSTTSRHYERYAIADRYRRLTNVEYARLQGFNDDHCDCISVYDQYALFGNAVPPPMAKWVLERLTSTGESIRAIGKGRLQRRLFIDA